MAENQFYDVIIVGGGTAGLTAAIYTQRSGKQALLYEALTPGGQIVNTPEIENYPGLFGVSGADYSMKLYEQAVALGAEIEFDTVTGVQALPETREFLVASGMNPVTFREDGTAAGGKRAKAVILATGAKNRPLGIGKETELIGHGVSYCATCDGMFYRGRDVAVVGGGNTALEDASFLAGYCRKVYVIHRREEFRGDQRELERLKSHDNVEFILNANVTGLLTADELAEEQGETVTSSGAGKLAAIEVTNKITAASQRIPVDGLFIAVGQMPVGEAFAKIADIDGAGYFLGEENCLTRTPGLFVAGDCRTKEVRQLTTAAADGAVAALNACKYIDRL